MIWNSILVDGIFLRKRVVNLVWNIQRHMYIVPSTAAAVWPTISFMVLLSIFTAQHMPLKTSSIIDQHAAVLCCRSSRLLWEERAETHPPHSYTNISKPTAWLPELETKVQEIFSLSKRRPSLLGRPFPCWKLSHFCQSISYDDP